jgi:hypothetical protein
MSLGFVPRPGERSPWDPAMLVGAWIDAGYARRPHRRGRAFADGRALEGLRPFSLQPGRDVSLLGPRKSAALRAPGVYATGYQRSQDGLLAFVSNLGETDVSARVRLDLRRLGLTGRLSAWDALSQMPIPLTDATRVLHIGRWQYRLLRIGAAAAK